MFSRFAAAGETLTGSEKDTVRGLLSGSDAARTQLGKLAPTAKDAVDGIVDAAFVRGQRGVMVLGVVLCGIGVWTALWGRGRVASTRRAALPPGRARLLARALPARSGQVTSSAR